MSLEATIKNSTMQAVIRGSNTDVVFKTLGSTTVNIGTFIPTPGPTGPAGASGTGARYTHTQVSASTVWVANHNLGYRPTVAVFSAGGIEVEAEVAHISTNQTQILFNTAVIGTATFL